MAIRKRLRDAFVCLVAGLSFADDGAPVNSPMDPVALLLEEPGQESGFGLIFVERCVQDPEAHDKTSAME